MASDASTRVMIFIDGSNLYHSLKNECGRTDIDLSKFGQCLTRGRRLVRTYYYNAQVDQTKDPSSYQGQQRFLTALKHLPYFEVRLGRLVYRSGVPFEKGIDVRLAADMLTHAYRNNFDLAILVSGDSDFADVLQAVKDLGKHIEVALWGSGASSIRLRETADQVITLDAAFIAQCWQ